LVRRHNDFDDLRMLKEALLNFDWMHVDLAQPCLIINSIQWLFGQIKAN
jgi:hypothetical protein